MKDLFSGYSTAPGRTFNSGYLYRTEHLISLGPRKICVATQVKKPRRETQNVLLLQCRTPLQESNVSKKHEWVMVRACFGLFIRALFEV